VPRRYRMLCCTPSRVLYSARMSPRQVLPVPNRRYSGKCTRDPQSIGLFCGGEQRSATTQSNASHTLPDRVAQNARGVVKGVVKGVTRALLARRAPLTPQLKRASARRREEKVFRGVYMIQQVAAVHLGWGQAPSLDSKMT